MARRRSQAVESCGLESSASPPEDRVIECIEPEPGRMLNLSYGNPKRIVPELMIDRGSAAFLEKGGFPSRYRRGHRRRDDESGFPEVAGQQRDQHANQRDWWPFR